MIHQFIPNPQAKMTLLKVDKGLGSVIGDMFASGACIGPQIITLCCSNGLQRLLLLWHCTIVKIFVIFVNHLHYLPHSLNLFLKTDMF